MAGRLAVIGSGSDGFRHRPGVGAGRLAGHACGTWTTPSLNRGSRRSGSPSSRFAAKGKISTEDVEATLGRITPTTDLDAAADADVVVEAIFERLEAKHEVFRALDKICKSGAVLGTNTSAIPITQIAAVTERPESVVGIHFFSPVPMMKLVELVRGYQTSDDTLATARDFAEEVGKTCVVVNRDVAGFVSNRLFSALVVEAVKLVESGVVSRGRPGHGDEARLRARHGPAGHGRPDRPGRDAARGRATSTATPQDEKFFPPELLQRMVTAGDLGRKTGKGFYTY